MKIAGLIYAEDTDALKAQVTEICEGGPQLGVILNLYRMQMVEAIDSLRRHKINLAVVSETAELQDIYIVIKPILMEIGVVTDVKSYFRR